MDHSQQIDHAEHAALQPCPDCGGPQYDDEHHDDCPRIAPQVVERTNPRTGRVEFRAYPHGPASNGGGAGPWTPDAEAAAANLAAALAVEAHPVAAELAAKLATAERAAVAALRDSATDELWRTRNDAEDSPRRRIALADYALAQDELNRRAGMLTGYSSTGQTASLSFMPDGRGGDAWVMLDKDPGTGSMSYPDSLQSWTITGGPIETLRAVVEHYRERAAFRARNGFPTDTPGEKHSRAWLADVEALADDTERTGRDQAAI